MPDQNSQQSVMTYAKALYEYRLRLDDPTTDSPLPNVDLMNLMAHLKDNPQAEMGSEQLTADLALYALYHTAYSQQAEKIAAYTRAHDADDSIEKNLDVLKKRVENYVAERQDAESKAKTIIGRLQQVHRTASQPHNTACQEAEKNLAEVKKQIEAAEATQRKHEALRNEQLKIQLEGIGKKSLPTRQERWKASAFKKMVQFTATAQKKIRKLSSSVDILSLKREATTQQKQINAAELWQKNNPFSLLANDVDGSLTFLSRLMSEERVSGEYFVYERQSLINLSQYLTQVKDLSHAIQLDRDKIGNLQVEQKAAATAAREKHSEQVQAIAQHDFAKTTFERSMQRRPINEGIQRDCPFTANVMAFEDELQEVVAGYKNDSGDDDPRCTRFNAISTEYIEKKTEYDDNLKYLNSLYQLSWLTKDDHASRIMTLRSTYAAQLKPLVDPKSTANQCLTKHPESFSKLTRLDQIVTVLSCLVVVGIPYALYRLFKSPGSQKALEKLSRRVPVAASPAP